MAKCVDEVRPHSLAVQRLSNFVSVLVDQLDTVLEVISGFVVALLDLPVLCHIGFGIPRYPLKLDKHLSSECIVLGNTGFNLLEQRVNYVRHSFNTRSLVSKKVSCIT